MARSRKTSKVGNLSFLLNPNLAIKHIADIDPVKHKTEHEFIKEKLNIHLKTKIAKLGEDALKEIPDENGEIKLFFANISVDFQTLKHKNLSDVIVNKLPETINGENRLKLENAIKGIATNGDITSILSLDTPLKDNPILAGDFRRAKIFEYANIINLNDEAAKKLADKDFHTENLSEATLSEWVKEKIIDDGQKSDLLLSLSLGRMCGENFELVKELKTDTLKSPVEFVSWDVSDWETFLKKNKISLPEGEQNVKSYAENLCETVEKSFPTEYFLSRTIKESLASKIPEIVGKIAALFKNNKKIVSENPFETISHDCKGISASDKKKIESDLLKLGSIVNTYRHLGIGEVLNQKNVEIAQKQEIIKNRFESLNKFYENNPEIDLNVADFSTTDTQTKTDPWKWEGVNAKEQPFIKKQMAAFQRVYVIGGSQEMGELLLKNGFDSAGAIIEKTEEEFLKVSGLDWEKGRKVYDKAQEMTIAASHSYQLILEAVKGTFNGISVGNQSPSLVNDLREIDGFDDLFGNQDFCDCEDCKSILGPAAYFTDLMYFVQKNISNKVFVPPLDSHPLYLKRRRPDLWTLKLTCQNTTTELPYLEVVNVVLEKYLATELSVPDIYEMLYEADLSCRQPFNLPLEEVRLFLSHFGLSLDEIYKTLNTPKSLQYREKLNLSAEELEIITTSNPAGTKRRFENIPLSNFNLQDFIRLAGISRSELDDLLKIESLPPVAQVKVNQVKVNGDIQKYNEEIINLTDDNLDLIHRFVRIWKKTKWNIREFDLILSAIEASPILSYLKEFDANGKRKFLPLPLIMKLSLITSIQEKLNLSVEEIATIIYELPQTSIQKDQKPFYERIFDLEKIFGKADPAANGNNTYKSEATLSANKSQDKITPLLLAGLGVSQSDLDALFKLLAINDRKLNIDVLSNLYRHASIARGLGISVEDLISNAKLTLSGSPITQLENIETVIEFADWLQESSFSASEILMILKGEETTEVKFKNDINSISAAILNIQANANKNLVAYLQQIYKGEDVEKNFSNLLEKATNDSEFSAATKVIQENTKKDKKELLKTYLQSTFNITGNQLDDEFLRKISLSSIKDKLFDKALNATFTNNGKPAELVDLKDWMQTFERFSFLFEKLQFDAEKISFFLENKAVFGITDIENLTVENFKNIVFYQTLLENDTENTGKINEVLLNFQANRNFSENANKILSDFWKVPQSLLASLSNTLTFSLPALGAVQYLWECLTLCQTLGIQGDALVKLKASDYQGLQSARNVMVGAFASKYKDEKTRKDKLEPYNDKLNTLKRDALCDYIISRSDTFKFKDRGDLYNFFLLDSEMSGCFRTTKLVAAITSLQHYIHRCLMNLEQSVSTPNIKINPTWIPSDEWEWRKNYRIWEANRKVFLYAENYLDPTLRDNKTEIFKELEDELLQQKITKESAEAAYKKYLAQFAELTRLRYAGAYYYKAGGGPGYANIPANANNPSTDAVYLLINNFIYTFDSTNDLFYIFARTNTDPYQYYFRTYNNYKKIWGNWQKIELGIEAREISTLIYQGKLYIFWTEVKSKEISNIQGGTPTPGGFIFKVYVKYSFLNENGKWSAPQRLYLGQNFVDESTVYRRVGYVTPDEKTREITLQKFEEKVFRKPYAILTNDVRNPISVFHIWSQKKGQTTVTYTTVDFERKIPAEREPRREYYGFSIPSQTFDITNDDFPKDSNPFEVMVRIIKDDDAADYSVPVQCTVKLLNSATCTASLSSFGLFENIKVGEPNDVPSTNPINTTNFYISLSRNEITNQTNQYLDADAVVTNITSPSLAALKGEYYLSYSENGDNQFYVESGTQNLTKNTISQFTTSDAFLVIGSNNSTNGWMLSIMLKLSTILTDEICDILFANGIEQFLSLRTQQLTDTNGLQLDFEGPYGEYYWEMFFHIPFLIADHFNANQKFKEAKWWYERIFNPTADEMPVPTKETDRNWRFSKFRNLNIEKLKEILTNTKAIEAYKKDPFNPHAIARLRLNAYQKSIVMKYIDNLLDWGDYLFSRDTRESINEAEMLYQLAFDILGQRPVKMGKCETADENDLTYEKIAPQIAKGSEFLITLENYYWTQNQRYAYEVESVKTSKNLQALVNSKLNSPKTLAEISELARYTDTNQLTSKVTDVALSSPVPTKMENKYSGRIRSYKEVRAEKIEKQNYQPTIAWGKEDKEYLFGKDSVDRVKMVQLTRPPGYEVVRSSLVFCVPPNSDLLKYWDRTEDRLFKIRNCMNIKGIRRSLALFQPPIDPMLLVRARAAGLSLEDITALFAFPGQYPPYRFSYLIEKAKQFTQTLQGFGSALLAALEKKDGEELILLRSVHEKNILKLTTDIKKKQVQEAQTQYKATEEGLINIQNRIDYYQALINGGLTGWEVTQQVSTHTATSFETAASIQKLLGSILFLAPQVGNPFAMKYGGAELGKNADAIGDMFRSSASIFHSIATSASMEATFQRREQEWKQQLKIAQQEFKQSNLQLLAADIRQKIAERDLEIHEKNIDQSDELFDFYKNKFTNLGLYNYMASTLNRLYRDAYNAAFGLAQSAEKAYQFETNDTEIVIQNDNWQFDRAGLLAGESLMCQLQTLEKKYIENHSRTPEITQTFSLAMLDAGEIIELRQKGSCNINIPEIAFEIFYPGQYRRIIKSVRISIPCIAGPYTNISAKLTLSSSQVKRDDTAQSEPWNRQPNTTSITASTAINDAGVFDFNFRDERYLPFEGAGAISVWNLELPSRIRSFDYNTISDVLLHISYTAFDGVRAAAENRLEESIKEYATKPGLFRLFSLRHEFPNAFQKLLSQDNQTTEFELTNSHFPYFLLDRQLNISKTTVYLKPKKGTAIALPTTMNINIRNPVNGGIPVAWNSLEDIPLTGNTGSNDIIKVGSVSLTGSPLGTWRINAGNQGIDKDKIEDILILIQYQI
jgi:hypothetical protein